MNHFRRSVIAYFVYLAMLSLVSWLSSPAHAQIAIEQAMGATSPLNQNLLVRDREVSAVATTLTQTYDMANASQILALVMVCSAGTAAVTVSASSDNTNFITIDSLTAAATTVKNYNNSTVGATTAVSPLAFRWIKISVASCGGGNTSTLTVGGK